jgi:hypothetical protein
MHRIGSDLLSPNPKRACTEVTQAAAPITFDFVPHDLIRSNILLFATPKDCLSFGRTCTTFYTMCKDDHFWHDVFATTFKGVSRLAKDLSWQEECKLQCLFVCNLLQGRYTSKTVSITGPTASCFAVAGDGRLIIGNQAGQIKILTNANTDEWRLLGLSRTLSSIDTLLCENHICVAADAGGELMAWNLQTDEKILIPQGEKGFSVEGAVLNQTALINGKLLRCAHHDKVIEVKDLDSADSAVLVFVFDQQILSMTIYNDTLYCGKIDESIELCNILTNKRTIYAKRADSELESFWMYFRVIPLQGIRAINETRCFSLTRAGHERTIMRHKLKDNSCVVTRLMPSFCAGMEEGLECQPKNDHDYSYGELSFVLQGFSDALCLFASCVDIGEALHHVSEPIHSCAKAYFTAIQWVPPPHQQVIFCADFTASSHDILRELALIFLNGNQFSEDWQRAARRLKKMPVSVQKSINLQLQRICFAKSATEPWYEAIMEHLNPGSVVTDKDILNKIVGLLGVGNEKQRLQATDALRDLVDISVNQSIVKIWEELAASPTHCGAHQETILKHAIAQYLKS